MINVNSAIDIAKQILRREADAIYKLVERLDSTFDKAIELILGHEGRLLVLGLGKSGHIARKIAGTLASTGQPSFFIHPTEAVHGDLGMMVTGDVCLMISHSGNTEELLGTIPAVKRIGLPIVAITANPESKLAKNADVVLNTHVSDEACPMNLAPTSSTTVTLALGDAIAITLLTMRGFKEDQFAMRHPGGILGKRLLTQVADIMVKENLPVVHKDSSFKEALSVMTKGKQGVVVVVDDAGRYFGIYTDGDIRRTIAQHDRISDIVFKSIFTTNPRSIRDTALATEALKVMQDYKITSLIVTDGSDRLVGLLHIHHLLEKGLI